MENLDIRCKTLDFRPAAMQVFFCLGGCFEPWFKQERKICFEPGKEGCKDEQDFCLEPGKEGYKDKQDHVERINVHFS
ncbi:hypothetical protein [Sphingobacterium hotanense]|uniref:hypothetical protein n=1 Tax=Sphingobacterium hotanense TaxID=649196 RepID=UPI0021A7F9A1|nr:hypothetical protein [Sphingobacterium hotanense]MCT1523185.1 hypothetical protein [Sphingobacterium hotanense]